MTRTALAAVFLVTAAVPLAAAPVTPSPQAAQGFSLTDVRLLDGPFKQAMERNAAYLLSLEPDRLLHNTRQYAGLTPKGELYGGWEGRGIAGHTLGHYLTAISQQYAATGDRRFRDRIDYIIGEMAACQQAYGDGYIGALPPKELATLRGLKQGKVEVSGEFNFTDRSWVPWYTEHKVLAGLLDAWTVGGNAQAKDVTLRLADWVDDVTKDLTPEQLQRMLQIEHGGMLESLVQVYALTGERRYLDTSRRFYHRAILDPLLAGRDDLSGKHANTQIPKVIGEARTYEVTGDADGRRIAEFFWDDVVNHRSFVLGGNSDREHFFPPGKARDHLTPATAETCNTYNMLKLTEHLFEWEPSVARADYYERALYNQILGSQEPKQGMFTYFVSLEPGHFKTYSTPTNSFWCCVGTGMENHTKYGEAIYFHGGDNLYVNLFIPSTLTWKEKGLTLEQRTDYPNEDVSEFTVQNAPATPVALLVRCPAWATGGLGFQLNGAPLDVKSQPGRYAEIARAWKKGDHLRVTIPMGLRTEQLEGDASRVAFLYGPLVLAGDLGAVPESKSFPYARDQAENFRAPAADVPVLVRNDAAGADLTASLKRVPGKDLAFRTDGIGQPADVTLRPLNSLFYERYNVYWNELSSQAWQANRVALQAAAERREREGARIVDELSPGEQQSEVDHGLASDRSQAGDFHERKYRDAQSGGYFEFQMKVGRAAPEVLRCAYWGDDVGRAFDILVDGQPLASQKLDHNRPGKFLDIEYPLPGNLVAGKDKVTVRFQPQAGSVAGGLFGAAILKGAP